MKTLVSFLLLSWSWTLFAAGFQAGLARTVITPPLPIWLNGYAARTNAAASVKSDLWAKALALRDDQGGQVVIVTTDLIGLPHEVSEAAAERIRAKHGLQRAQVLLSSSHTHAGPVIWPELILMFDLTPADKEQIMRYTRKLTDDLVDLVGSALANRSPAQLSFGRGTAAIAINRRQPSVDGVRLGVNTNGPVDHSVPVLKVAAPDGTLRAVLLGYACHNTTLGGDFYQVDGDYAGFAQREIERAHPGATAMFMILCGADQNPHPRGRYENVEAHGRSLAAAVEKALGGDLKPVRPPIRTGWRTTELDFASHTRQQFEDEATNKNVYKQRRAKAMLEAYDQGKPIRRLTYPVQAVRLNNDLTLLALAGEVVVDYSNRARQEYPAENLVVAGYCNEVSCYIPSLRVLREGGYEPVDSMIYYGQPGPFAENVEETVFRCVRDVMAQAGAGRRP